MATNLPRVHQPIKASPRGNNIEVALQDAVSGGISVPDPGNTTYDAPTRNTLYAPHNCTLGIHDDAFSREDVLVNGSIFTSWNVTSGTRMRIVSYDVESPRNVFKRKSSGEAHSRSSRRMSTKKQDGKSEISYVFVVQNTAPELLSKHPNLEVSISQRVATSLGFKNRCQVTVTRVDERAHTASHVEIAFRDAYLTRADMWRLLVSELAGKSMYKGQRLLFMNTIKAQVKTIYDRGAKRQSAFFGNDTKPIFRSESARYVLFLQMSKEMWDFDADGTGEIMFHKVINGFLPELFQRWQDIGAHHLVSIILFTRMEYEQPLASTLEPQKQDSNDPTMNYETDKLPYRDFYRVLVSDMASGQWASILNQLKKDFKTFLRDVSLRTTSAADKIFIGQEGLSAASKLATKEVISGRPTSASQGNILEAINVASSQFSGDYIDRDLVRTGLSIIVVSPGTGVFEVDYNLLSLTTDVLIENGVGIDLVCLSRMPLHSVPLFKYKRPRHDRIDEISELKGENPVMAMTMGTSFGSTHSYTSTSRLSRVPSAENLSRAANSALFGNKDPWHYGVPHWVDVSFWTPSPGGGMDSGLNSNSLIAPAQRPFVPRVRMYEVQMMGVMENEMSNISIPYLNTPATDRSAESRSTRSQTFTAGMPSALSKDQHLLSLSDRLEVSFSQSPSPGKLSNLKAFSSFFQWMEDYDNAVFKQPSQHQMRRLAIKPRVDKSRSQSHRLSQPLSESVGGLSVASSASTMVEKQHGEQMTLHRPLSGLSHKSSASSTLAKPQSSAAKPTKLSRHISFGFRGFGGAAPKAIPVAEVSSEIAISESLLTRSIRSSARQESTKASSINSLETGKSKKPESNAEKLQANSDHVSKPIPIKPPSRDSSTAKAAVAGEQANYEKFLGLQEKLPIMEDADASSLAYGLSPRKAMAPWLTVLNPWNPSAATADPNKRLGRWHHVYPRPLYASNMKWKSLCSPASVPLTTEDFPTSEQLKVEYEEKEYTIAFSEEPGQALEKDPEKWLKRELISARFSHGFQIVTSNRLAQQFGLPLIEDFTIFDDDCIGRVGSKVFMMRGSSLHQLTTNEDGTIGVRMFIRRPAADISTGGAHQGDVYRPAVRTNLSDAYTPRELKISSVKENYDWQRLDQFIAGHEEQQNNSYPNLLNFWRTRYVLIPMQEPEENHGSSGLRTPNAGFDEGSDADNEEEVRLEGIKKLTQLWQKHRYVPPEERRFGGTARKKQDNNPLDIIYRTMKPSAIVATEAGLLESGAGESKAAQLLPDSDLFERSNLKLASLARVMQSEKGIKIMNRRWHWRIHANCFIGMEFTTWLFDNFRDVDTREEAVELGNELMNAGLFVHVEGRHNFRDGNYFYKIADQYLVRKEPRMSWFARSVPSTPISDNARASPSGGNLPARSGQDSESSHPGGGSFATGDTKLTVALSKSLIYDVDHRHRSYRQELITLHYDRIASVDNCYHLRIDWMNVTPKLIEDTIGNWASLAERNGLRLVELPIAEASKVNEFHPFRGPYMVKPVLPPPEVSPQAYFDNVAPSPRLTSTVARTAVAPNRYLYHEAILKRHNFVLDLEAATDFPSHVRVSYSWGQPDYRYPQYIHRSGVLLAQITPDGSLLLLANRLYNKRTAGSSHRSQPNQQRLQPNPSPRLQAESSGREQPPPHHQAWGGGTFTSPRGSPRASPMVRPVPDSANASTANLNAPSQRPSKHPSRSSSAIRNNNGNNNVFNGGEQAAIKTPEALKDELERFCNDRAALEWLYQEVWGRLGGGLVTPALAGVEEATMNNGGVGDNQLEPVTALSLLGGEGETEDEGVEDGEVSVKGFGTGTPLLESQTTTPIVSPKRKKGEREESATLAALDT